MTIRSPEDAALVRRTCYVYLTIFAWSGFNQPYLPVWLSARGLGEAEIGLIIGLPMFTRILVTPMFGRLADSVADRRVLMRAMILVALLLGLALWSSRTFWPILILYVAMMMPLQNVSPIFDASALDLVRRGVVREFGRMRLWGSAGYALTAVAGGSVLAYGGSEAVFAAFMLAVVALLAGTYALPPAPRGALRPHRGEPDVWRRPAAVAMMLAAALVLASQATWNGFGSIRLREQGVPDGLIGVIWAAATVSELAMFWAGPALAGRLGPVAVLALAAAGSALRWALMALDPGPAAVIGLQLFHALTFSCAHLGVMSFLAATVDLNRSGSAQATFVTISAIVLGGATIAAGPLYAAFGGLAYLGSALLPALALLIILFFRRRISDDIARAQRERQEAAP